MPYLGEIRKGCDAGKKAFKHNFIWADCEDCGKERWVEYRVKEDRPLNSKCLSCGSLDQGIRGRGYRDKDGYKLIRLSRQDSFAPMAVKSGYALDHRVVVAKSLGRCLTKNEIVHHMNGKKNDNRLENLTLCTRSEHIHMAEPYKKRIAELEDKLRKTEMAISTPCLN